MVDDPQDTRREIAVPTGQLSRMLRMGRMGGGIAGGVLAEGASRLARGERPRMADLVMTPANARRLADQLSQMRGAAMKVGQLISMDAGDVLPPEIAAVLARLRDQADFMPPKQLRDVLDAEWGQGWRARFTRFDVRPMAAASIGQVHRAVTRDGRDLAIKVQYPGVRDSIDSDVRNVAALIRISGALPRDVDLSPMLDEARAQLHFEADYLRERENLRRFADLLQDDPDIIVPRPHDDLSTRNVLAMDFVDSAPLDTLVTAPQDVRDRAAGTLIRLVLRELFDFAAMQTDPNFANYRHVPASGRLVLLDFGAVSEISDARRATFHTLLHAGLSGDREAARRGLMELGLFDAPTAARHQDTILDMFDMAMEAIRGDGAFDFASSDLLPRLRNKGLSIGTERDFWHVPPTDTLLVQRKVLGTYLAAARLGARVDLARIVGDFA